MLTHGSPLGVAALAVHLKPSSESHTAVVDPEESSPTVFSQILHHSGDRSALINFLVTCSEESLDALPMLWEYLCYKAGEMGALNVLAGIDESSVVFESLRKCGFTVYGWESVCKLPGKFNSSNKSESNWSTAKHSDETLIRGLYQVLVPPLVQSAEAFSNHGIPRLVYRVNNEIVAYIESASGPEGLYLKPIIHPAVEDIQTLLSDLFSQVNGLGLPVYIQVRSYQAWLLDALQQVGGEVSARFSLLVKNLAVMQRNGVIITQRKQTDQRQAEPTAPMVNHYLDTDHGS